MEPAAVEVDEVEALEDEAEALELVVEQDLPVEVLVVALEAVEAAVEVLQQGEASVLEVDPRLL